MSREEATVILGKPDGFKVVDEHVVYTYTNKLISGWAWDRTDYHVIFKDEMLIEYGNGEVRQKDVGGVNHIFIWTP